MEKLLLKPMEAADMLGLGRSKLYALLAAGELPGVVKIGRSTRIERASLERWVRERVAEASDNARA